MLHDAYVQNHKQLKEYYQAVAGDALPVSKGIKLTTDDILRRDVIMCIMSNFYLHKQEIEDKYHINFDEYFSQEIAALKPLAADGLVSLSSKHIQVTEIGRLLVRNIAVVFDIYHHNQDKQFSRTI